MTAYRGGFAIIFMFLSEDVNEFEKIRTEARGAFDEKD